jgi:hypothetical protein
MLSVMTLTCFDVLSEHNLLTPDSAIKNIPIMSLLILEFLLSCCTDWEDLKCGCEIVRLCDEAGIKLDEHVRKQVAVSAKQIRELREEYEEKKEAGGYEKAQAKEGWKREDDVGEDGRLWCRWDWEKEVSNSPCIVYYFGG